MPVNPTFHTAGLAAADYEVGYDVGAVTILNEDATAWLYARADGTAAVVRGDGSYSIPPGSRRSIPVTTDGDTVVSVIATEAASNFELEV